MIRGIENNIFRIQLKAAIPVSVEDLLTLMRTLSEVLEMGYLERRKSSDRSDKKIANSGRNVDSQKL